MIQADLDKILSRGGRTAVMVAHRLSTIAGADMIVAMENGTVAELGTHKQLLDKGLETGLYARWWGAQAIYSAKEATSEDKSNCDNESTMAITSPSPTKIIITPVAKSPKAVTSSSVSPRHSVEGSKSLSKNDEVDSEVVTQIEVPPTASVVDDEETLAAEDPEKNKAWRGN